MSKQNKRRNFDGNFKAKVAIEAIQEKLTLSELAAKHNVFPTQISECKSDAYYKTLTTQKQLISLFYGVITKCNSFNSLCKNLQFLENKLACIGMLELPARSTLSDGNCNRDPKIFEMLYGLLYEHYAPIIVNEVCYLFKDS
jgi:hypothetical protein